MAWGNMVSLLVGGVVIVGLGYVALKAFGAIGPRAAFNPNPISKDFPHEGMVNASAGGFKPNEVVNVTLKKLDGTVIIEGNVPQPVDANGNVIFTAEQNPTPALIHRAMAEFLGAPGGYEWCYVGAQSGTAYGRLIIEPGYPAIPPPVIEMAAGQISRLTGGAGSYSANTMRMSV